MPKYRVTRPLKVLIVQEIEAPSGAEAVRIAERQKVELSVDQGAYFDFVQRLKNVHARRIPDVTPPITQAELAQHPHLRLVQGGEPKRGPSDG